MSYISANKSLNNRLADDTRSVNRRRSSMFNQDSPNHGGNTSGMLFDIPPVERQARFEEWIKLTTDNKINTSNSWAVALIDYFHDMEIFRDGDGINFQKLSTTLDGCVKVYSSRIDSVITETGKLLSGLSTKREGEEDEDEKEENEEENHGSEDEENAEVRGTKDGERKRKKADSTLKNWSEVKMRSLDQELSIDPLFKKTLAEFDEGGAKSLLMHMLTVDENVRVMFDTSTGATQIKDEVKKIKRKNKKINIGGLKTQFFGQSEEAFSDSIQLCPSLNQLEDVVGDIERAKTVLKEINFDSSYNFSITTHGKDENGLGTLTQASQAVLFNENFDNDNFGDAPDWGDDNVSDDFGVNEINEDVNDNKNEASGIFASTSHDNGDDTELDHQLLNYFDEELNSNWKYAVHWKVKLLKKNFDIKESQNNDELQMLDGKDLKPVIPAAKRQRKEEFKIDFMDDQVVNDENIFIVNKNSKTTMVIKESDDFFLLPDDTFFSSKNLIHLFTKEEQKLKFFKTKKSLYSEDVVPQDEIADENFWAENYGGPSGDFDPEQQLGNASFGNNNVGDLDDDDDDDDNLVPDEMPESQEFGTQLLTNSRSANRRTVNFARVAKRVDLIALKENLWTSITEEKQPVLEFKNIVKSTVKVYPKEQKKDLSTSFEFIALLHLANEKGFVIETNEDQTNLFINLEQKA